MEDDLMKNMQDYMSNAQSDIENFKKLTGDNYNQLTDEQKKELNKAMDGVDMQSLTKVVNEASLNIMNHIQGMFK